MVSSNGGPLAEALRKKYWGVQAKRYFDEVYAYELDLSYIGDCLPTRHNRVVLRRDAMDRYGNRYGMPGTEIIYRPHTFDMHASVFAATKAKQMLKVVGATTEDDTQDPMVKKILEKKPTARQLYQCTGGCRMGVDEATSVVDPTCRVPDIENLDLADGSVFPTSSGLNPTLTMQANARRVGNAIVKTFGGG